MKSILIMLAVVILLGTAGCFDFNNENHNYPPGENVSSEGMTLDEWVQKWHDTPSIQDKYSLDTWISMY